MFLQIDLTFLVTFFIIWVLVFILRRTFFKPMVKIMRDRDAQIQGDRAASEEKTRSYEEGLQEVERTLRAARQAAEKTRIEMEDAALREKSHLVAEASAAAKGEVEKAKAKLQDEIDRLRRELGAHAETMAERIEKRLLN